MDAVFSIQPGAKTARGCVKKTSAHNKTLQYSFAANKDKIFCTLLNENSLSMKEVITILLSVTGTK